MRSYCDAHLRRSGIHEFHGYEIAKRLGNENNRSPGTEIALFARDILHGKVRGAKYRNVSRIRFQSNAMKRNSAIRQSLGIISKSIFESTGKRPESIAMIASYGSGVAIISAALRQQKEIKHQVLFDEAFVMLASRIGAFLLEPKMPGRRRDDVATFLDLLAEAHRAKGGKTALQCAKRLMLWALKTRAGEPPKVKLASAIDALLQSVAEIEHTGSPQMDWTRVKRELRSSSDPMLSEVANAIDYLVAFNRGERIAANLSELWLVRRAYCGARGALDSALMKEQLLSGADQLQGIDLLRGYVVEQFLEPWPLHIAAGESAVIVLCR